MTTIAWTDETWNPVRGCSRVSAGCEHCYAERMAHRNMGGHYDGLTRMTSRGPTWTGEIRLVPEKLDQPLRWRKPRRIFVNSMSDLFHEGVPDEYIAAVFGIMAASPLHTFQILTKRPERMREWCTRIASQGGIGPYIRGEARRALGKIITNEKTLRTEVYRGQRHRAGNDAWMMVFNAAACSPGNPLGNVWLGVSVEDKATADERIPLLLQTPAAVRFLSVEPLLGPVDLRSHLAGYCREHDFEGGFCVQRNHPGVQHLGWVITGGESGPGARPCNAEWIRDVVRQCDAASVPVFVKQLGSHVVESNRVDNLWPKHTGFTKDEAHGWRVHPCWCATDPKATNPEAWPADLRRQEFPS